MKQYVIIARDGTDTEALPRRMAARPAHLAGVSGLKANGHYVSAGAMLDDDGKMKGSVMILQFETDADFQQWYANEPYVQEGVWKEIEVHPFRVAQVD